GQFMSIIQRFEYDNWITVTSDELNIGDLITHVGLVISVTGMPYIQDGTVHIPGQAPESLASKIDLSDNSLARALDYVGSTLQEFEDGTAMIADLEWAPGFVYSPRLPKVKLMAFCELHLERYKAFYEEHQLSIEDGKTVSLQAWWKPMAQEHHL
ncbi:hypothetical protein QN393_24335, partial [Pseudomonas sp. AB12(2023)]|nr:hypothetical protein [Pseudomonas sp. AB12(2023)]